MERCERSRPELEGLSVDRSRKQIDRIPDAPLLEKTVEAGQNRHGHGASEPSLDARRDSIRFERKQSAWKVWRYGQPFHFAASGGHYDCFHPYFDPLFFLLRENVPEPSDAPSQEQNRPKNADREAGDKASQEQCDTEGKSDGPSGGRGQMNRASRGLRRLR